MFENARTSTKQGDIGESRAIYEYTRMGYAVSVPIFDSELYDLVIDDGNELKRVQVKTTDHLSEYGVYKASLKTSGGNRSFNTVRNREDSDYDELFVMCGNDDCYMIPVDCMSSKTYINLGKKYIKYKL